MEFAYYDLCTGQSTARKLESPIEIMFYEAFNMQSYLFKARYNLCTLDLNPQYPVHDNGKTYYADFSIDVISVDINAKEGRNDICMSYAIECDGHEFHEKTKEQATHDKQRERILLNHFSKVIRFSGSEIYKDANECVREALGIIRKDLQLAPNPKQAGGY